jgi:DNA polymerase V
MSSPIIAKLIQPQDLTLLQECEPASSLPTPWRTRTIGQRIPAGFPLPAADYSEDGLDLNEYLVPNKSSTFFFTVVGDSMCEVGILDGDQVAVDRSIEARHGHIVIAIVNNECTIKRLYRKNGIVELRPENPAYQPIRLQGLDELHVWGVVTGQLRRFAV